MTQRGYMLDMKPTGFGLVSLGYHARASHADPLTDNLYVVIDAIDEPEEDSLPLPSTAPSIDVDLPDDPAVFVDIYQFDSETSGSDMVYSYKGKLNLLPRPSSFVFCQVKAQDYDNLLLKIFADGVEIFSRVIESKEPFTLPLTDEYDEFEFEVFGTSRVRSLQFVEDIRELT